MQALAELQEPELINMAAKGDRDAQAQLVIRCILKEPLAPFEALSLAEPFARMAAEHGHVDDRLMLAAVLRIRARHLCIIGDPERAGSLLSYSRSLCDDLTGARLCPAVEYLAAILTTDSDQGDANADTLLSRLMSSLSASDADQLRQLVNTAVKERATREMAQ